MPSIIKFHISNEGAFVGYEFYLNKTVKEMGMRCEGERLQVTGASLRLAMFTLTFG